MLLGPTLMANNLFTVALFGFSQLERTLITSVCKLSQARQQRVASRSQPGFQVLESGDSSSPDILLVDADNHEALEAGAALHSQQFDAPLIIVSKAPVEPSRPNEYTLARSRLGGLLLKSLDRIIEQWEQGDAATPAGAAAGSGKTCLVVDDSQLVRTQMEMILGEHPLAIKFAEDAETALKIVQQQTFDIIFLDVMLPEMNGYKACKLLKADPNTSATPVVMLTSKKSPFNRMHGALVGCDKYLTKPVDANKVQQVLKQYDVVDEITRSQQASLATR